MATASSDDPVGSLGEEAAKLWGALSEWARTEASPEPGPDTGAGAADGAGPQTDPLADAVAHTAQGLAETLRRVETHVATGDAECRYCPLCRAIHVVRETSPEVRRHLGEAAGSLLSAAAELLGERAGGDVPSSADPAQRPHPSDPD